MIAGDLILGNKLKEHILYEGFQNSSKEVYVSIGSTTSAKIGNAELSNFIKGNGMITLNTGSKGILYNVSASQISPVTIKHIFLGSSPSTYKDIGTINLEDLDNEQITFEEEAIYIITSLKIGLQEGN